MDTEEIKEAGKQEIPKAAEQEIVTTGNGKSPTTKKKKFIIIGIIAVICIALGFLVYRLTIPTTTPFDKLTEIPSDGFDDVKNVLQAYGEIENWDENVGKDWIRYNDYEWRGEKGTLRINFEMSYFGGYIKNANWSCDTDNPDKVVKKLKQTLDKAFGNSEYDKEATTYTWYDKYGYKYVLDPNYKYNNVTVYYRIH